MLSVYFLLSYLAGKGYIITSLFYGLFVFGGIFIISVFLFKPANSTEKIFHPVLFGITGISVIVALSVAGLYCRTCFTFKRFIFPFIIATVIVNIAGMLIWSIYVVIAWSSPGDTIQVVAGFVQWGLIQSLFVVLIAIPFYVFLYISPFFKSRFIGMFLIQKRENSITDETM